MTIEELLGKSADELDAMSAAEREAYFAPFLAVTRPDRAVIVEAVQKGVKKQMAKANTPGMQHALAFLKQMGIEE